MGSLPAPTACSARRIPATQAASENAAHVLARGGSQRRAQVRVLGERPDPRGERLGVARGRHQAVAPVAHEPAGDGADGVARDHWRSLVHGLVHDQPPRLEESCGSGSRGGRARRRPRRAAGSSSRSTRPSAPTPGPAGAQRAGAGEHERRARRRGAARRHASSSTSTPFSRSSRPTNSSRKPSSSSRPPSRRRAPLGAHRRSELRGRHRLRRLEHVSARRRGGAPRRRSRGGRRSRRRRRRR